LEKTSPVFLILLKFGGTKMKKLSLLIAVFLFSATSTFAQEKPNFDSKLPDKIKAVFDWTLEDPKDSEMAVNFISNFIKAFDEFNPMGEYSLAIVSHGPKALIFSKKNYEKYKNVVDRLNSMTKSYNLKIYVCRNIIKALGLKEEDLQPFITIVPAGVVELAKLQEEGYKLIPTVVHDLKKFKQ
jgi:intracellular sulfur oxidation DsrE/DsrF family protein